MLSHLFSFCCCTAVDVIDRIFEFSQWGLNESDKIDVSAVRKDSAIGDMVMKSQAIAGEMAWSYVRSPAVMSSVYCNPY